MIVVMQAGAEEKEIQGVVARLEKEGFKVHLSRGTLRTVIGAIGDKTRLEHQALEAMPGVEKVIPILKPYKLAAREFKPENTIVEVGKFKVGGPEIHIIAGPCAVESREQLLETAHAVREAGATMLRGGAFKPRTSPYSFQGLAERGLKLLAEAREETGLAIVTEVTDQTKAEAVAQVADVLQIGSRNMQNFALLKTIACLGKPVLLKRGLSATIEEWLLAAEYILAEGNFKVILCERGIRTFETYTRNTLDLSALVAVKQLSHLPVLADPSHGTGKKELVIPLARAAIAAGADGLLIEVHPKPENALSDGPQSLRPEEFFSLVKEVVGIAKVLGRSLGRIPA
ncbi:3-deoxy-D-arabinoheptulosonate-7-phosphate synthase [Thermanaeromonas toyohensis ToBE]|uniref:3-deoxy-D-arabinoheptulosonate-7-phosphate synthase n=1 Tax=Thermanaeromonas toyohensis ToBE TaxID=698762 RepID=A0A1W1VYC5_9FIRM|nr:3-deoxy-7-phosphoheptulonate synthase [Thermanaeromonas toyohensis]SMB98336.1 3-deoxy-D-arabinoheptulosonate-7-phosphate synthase [Thermanaeromonas toyohensis ToBE]